MASVALLWVACGPSKEEIARLADEIVATALAAIPTDTPSVTVTPQPTATPIEFPPTVTPPFTPTPQPTSTPLVFPPTVTPQPTATPIALPPTTTPQPPPTPQPTATPFQIPTPLPTATPFPTPTPQRFPDLNSVYNETSASVFLIETASGTGTGWLIEPGLILTNQHVVGSNPTVLVRQISAPPFTAIVRAVDVILDIALLRFIPSQVQLEPDAKPLPLGTIFSTDRASPVLAMGHSGGLTPRQDGSIGSPSANVGVLSSIVTFTFYGFSNLIIDAPVDPGDSGGPVLNAEGKVVGMVRAAQVSTASGQRVVGTFYAVDIDEIRNALPKLKRGESRSR